MCVFSYRMSCSQCVDALNSTYHDKCRSHAYCARDYRYHAAPCAVCQDLWERARDISAPEGAMVAYHALEDWIAGFRRNSRHRTRGMDYFFDPAERSAFQDLHAIHANLEIAASFDDPHYDAARPSVSHQLLTYRGFV